jgi:DNA-binding beta-propeller fold protein YncE
VVAEPPPPSPSPSPPPPATESVARSGRSRRLLTVGGVAVAALVLGAVAVLLLSGGDGDHGSPAGDSVGALPVKTFDPGITPEYLAATSRYLWVLDGGAPSRLARFDVGTARRAGASTELQDYLEDIAVVGDRLWIAGDEQVIEVDGESGTETGREIETPVGISSDLVAQGSSLWHVDYSDDDYSEGDVDNGQLFRLDPDTRSIGEPVEVPSCTAHAAASDDAVYVGTTCRNAGISRVQWPSGEVVSRKVDAGGWPFLAVGHGSLWVTNEEDGTVLELDPNTLRRRGRPIDVGNFPQGIEFMDGLLWVSVYGDDAVVRLEPKSRRTVGDPIPVGDKPGALVAQEGRVWVQNTGDGTISRIDASAR